MVDRPVECSECKKNPVISYKEIMGPMTCTKMCAECPILQQKLHGQSGPSKTREGLTEAEGGLCCGHCLTSLESVKMGSPLGCTECYSVFSDLLLSELIAQDRIAPRTKKELASKKTQPLHLGKSPNNPSIIPSSSRLTALNEALNDALKIENYEQAAWIRDQIKSLIEKGGESGKT